MIKLEGNDMHLAVKKDHQFKHFSQVCLLYYVCHVITLNQEISAVLSRVLVGNLYIERLGKYM